VSIETQKPKGLARLLAERIKIADEYEDEAWAPLRRELLKATSFLELYNDEKFPLEEEQQEHIKQLGATLFLQIVRLKPEHLFYGETCEYARLLNNATTRIDSVLPLTSYCIYSNLLNLKLEYSLERTCSGNKNILSGYGKKVRHIKCDGIPGRWAIHGKKTETNIRFEDNMPWWGYLVTIFIIFGVARICGGTDEHRSPGRNNHHYTMPVLPDAKQKIIDSIATKILTGDISLDSAQRLYMKSLKKPIENRQTDGNE
jgi:hypothetical protein